MHRDVLVTIWRILSLRFTAADLEKLDHRHLVAGLLCTWVVGMGRYWDNPSAHTLQLLGVGSLVYVFVLSLYLYLIVLPLRPPTWRFRHLLIFVTLTSPPAILYAIPVERFTSFGTARELNLYFLVIVAAWRVAMYFRYLGKVAGLRGVTRFAAGFLPLSLIVVALALLNLEHAVFAIMAGIDTQRTTADSAYFATLVVAYLSYLAAPALLILYLLAAVTRWMENRKDPEEEERVS